MLELARHIEILLLDNDCVIVPGLGGFVTHHIPARHIEEECKFLPPYRTLGFSPKMTMNDGLLVQSYMQAYDTNYPSALRLVEEKIEELKDELQKNGLFDLHGIGTLRQNVEGEYNFTPLEAGLLSPSLYGLGAFEMHTLEQIQGVEDTSATNIPLAAPAELPQDEEKAIVISMNRKWVTRAVAACIGLLFILAISIPTFTGSMNLAESKPLVEWINNICKQETIAKVDMSPKADKAIVKNKATAPKKEVKTTPVPQEETTPAAVESPKAEAPAPAVNTAEPYYTIVLVSSITTKNAERFANEMAQKGYPESKVLQKDNLNRVVYSQFASEADAWNQLHKLRKESSDFTEAWILKVK